MDIGSEPRKRARSVSSSSGDSDVDLDGDRDLSLSPLGSPLRAAKYHRAPSPPKEFLCTLPPTCSQPGGSQAFGSQGALDAHQAAMHRWVCRVPIRDKPGRAGEGGPVLVVPEQFAGRAPIFGARQRWRECGKVFPDERLLELHGTETHDPIARERQERGEKIFACFLPEDQCGKVFLTPKKRRLHLIEKHHYPIAYFFSITNHGLNLITRTDGPAASLIRPRRDPDTAAAGANGTRGAGDTPTSPKRNANANVHAHSHIGHAAGHPHAPASHAHAAPARPPDELDVDMDGLAAKMAGMESSLVFVPRGLRRKARDRETRGGGD